MSVVSCSQFSRALDVLIVLVCSRGGGGKRGMGLWAQFLIRPSSCHNLLWPLSETEPGYDIYLDFVLAIDNANNGHLI